MGSQAGNDPAAAPIAAAPSSIADTLRAACWARYGGRASATAAPSDARPTRPVRAAYAPTITIAALWAPVVSCARRVASTSTSVYGDQSTSASNTVVFTSTSDPG